MEAEINHFVKYNDIHLSNIHGNWRDSDIDYLEE